MEVELAFRNESGSKIAERRTVYVAIDDERGESQVRRPLPNVDFTNLDPIEKFAVASSGKGRSLAKPD